MECYITSAIQHKYTKLEYKIWPDPLKQRIQSYILLTVHSSIKHMYTQAPPLSYWQETVYEVF